MKQLLRKVLSVFLAIAILSQCIFVNKTYALTGGPSAPEFTSFEPVATTNMVNEFTGDFTYNLPVLNVPGPNGSGYAVSLSYHAGTTPEEESGWVGYGWTLNPGAINRGKKGFADDINGSTVTYSNKMKRNFTSGYGIFTSASYDGFGVNASLNARYNNYKGYSFGWGLGTDVYGAGVGYDYDVNDETASFSVSLNVADIIMSVVGAASKQRDNNTSKSSSPEEPKMGDKMRQMAIQRGRDSWREPIGSLASLRLGSNFGVFGTELIQHATQVPQYTGFAQQFTLSVGVSAFGVSLGAGYNTSYSYQDMQPSTDRSTYGYLYTHNVTDDDAMMDYCTDKSQAYVKDDKHLPMPASNPDMFMVSGEGLGGNFRFYNKNTIQYRPAHTKSSTEIRIAGSATVFGGSMETVSIGSGTSTSVIGKWQDAEDLMPYKAEGEADEAYFARFDNDLGGNISSIDDDDPYAVGLSGTHKGDGTISGDLVSLFAASPTEEQLEDESDYNAEYLGTADFGEGQSYSPSINTTDFPKSMELNSNGRVGRSSYIGYHTNSQINKNLGYNSNNNFTDFIDRSQHKISDGIGEIVTYNESGLRYNYGLPVYARNEVNMRYGLSESDEANIENNYLVYKDISSPSKIDMIAGETSNTPYATTFLLTDITTPDYIDRTLDGPSSDDFGGYTKFNYTQTYGSKVKDEGSNWYRWRVPYEGLLYDRGQLSNSIDDAGYVMCGEKEMYYLESIETKTHIAKFILSDRLDGIEAAKNETAAKGNVSLSSLKKSKKLDRIELYTKDVNGHADKLIQTVNFQFDYSLMRGLPNSTGSSSADAALDKADGRLTLKKLWFNYQGIYNAKISPYEFTYAYKSKSDFPSQIQDKYASVVNYGKDFDQNPSYASCNIDPWGNYQANGCDRIAAMKKWVTQHPTSTFDPAAWQLKQIKLPSGGEILVQYEQNDYQYVQNYPAFAMVKLKSSDGVSNYQEAGDLDKDAHSISFDPNYYLDVSDIGISKTDANYTDELNALKDSLTKYFINQSSYKADGNSNNPEYVASSSTKNQIYAKFLYGLTGETPQIGNCNVEYISGYVFVSKIGVDANGLYITLGNSNYGSSMRDMAQDFVKTNGYGVVSGNCWANNGKSDIDETVDVTQSLDVQAAIGKQFMGCDGPAASAADFMAWTVTPGGPPMYFIEKLNECNNLGIDFEDNVVKNLDISEDYCKYINLDHSYLKIPIFKGKKGGGIRVKRILMNDAGIGGNTDDGSLYGNEYLYQKEDGTSSGVATNEPASIREENGLVQPLTMAEDQKWWESAMHLDKRQMDGPLGEMLYPGASIGYSRVVVKNIHSGATNPGFEVKQFYTSFDYPTKVSYTNIDDEDYDPLLPTSLEETMGKSLTYETANAMYTAYQDMKTIYQDFIDGKYNTADDFESDVKEVLTFLGDLADTYPALNASVGTIIDVINAFISMFDSIKTVWTSCGDCLKGKTTSCATCVTEVARLGLSVDLIYTFVSSLYNMCTVIYDFLYTALGLDGLLNSTTNDRNVNKLWATQGYSLKQNSMNGQPKSAFSYEGSYDYVNLPSSVKKVKGLEYAYYHPSDKVSIMKDFESDEYSDEYIGRTQELVMEDKAIKDHSSQTVTASKMENLFVIQPKTTTSKSQTELYTHVTSKIMHYPAIQKSLTTYSDGVASYSENTAFSKHNGKAVVSKSYDEFNDLVLGSSTSAAHNGTYTSYSFPASYKYEEMEQKADNEGFVKESCNNPTSLAIGDNYAVEIDLKYKSPKGGGTINTPYLELSQRYDISIINGLDNVLAMLHPGDLITISLSGTVKHFYIQDIEDNIVNLYGMNGPCTSDCDEMDDINLFVLKSSRTNQLNEVAGSLLKYGDCTSTSSSSSTSKTKRYSYPGRGTDAKLNNDNSIFGNTTNGITLSSELGSVKASIDPKTNSSTDIDLKNNIIQEYVTDVAYNISQNNITTTNQMGNFAKEFYNTAVSSSNATISYGKFSQMVQTYKTKNSNSYLNNISAAIDKQQSTKSASVKSVSGIVSQLNSYGKSLKAGQKVTVSMPYQASTKTSSGGLITSSKTMSVEVSKTSDSKNSLKVTVNNGGSSPSTYTVSGNSKWSINKDGKLSIGDKASGASTSILMPSDIDYTYGNNMFFDKYDCYVLQASATKYDDSWSLDDNMKDVFDISNANPYLTGEKGKWRAKETWVYNSTTIGGAKDESGERIYANADAATAFYLFDWSSTTEQSNWQKIVSVDYYSPNGDALEDKNMFDVYSATKFGYNGAVPYLAAQNADYNSVFFESFENKYSSDAASIKEYEDAYKISEGHTAKSVAHSGSQSLLLTLDKTTGTPSTPYTTFPLKTFTLTSQELSDGALVRFWIKTQSDTDPSLKLIEAAGLYDGVAFTKVDRVWDWTLYEAKLTNWKSIAVGSSYTPRIYISGLTATDNIWVDDIRFQPASAEMSCYVYDPATLRLLTSFDSQHFGLYYQYNAEGKLTRKIAETEKGKRTVEEKQYNQVASQRPYSAPASTSASPSSGGTSTSGGGTFDFDFTKINADATIKTGTAATEGINLTNFVKGKAYNDQGTIDRNTDILKQFVNSYTYNVNTKFLSSASQKTAFMKSFYSSYLTTKGSAASYTDFTNLVTEYQTTNTTSSLNTLFK